MASSEGNCCWCSEELDSRRYYVPSFIVMPDGEEGIMYSRVCRECLLLDFANVLFFPSAEDDKDG
jgi:hypothetical protein